MRILIETYQRLLRDLVPVYQRKFYDDFRMDSRCIGIVGARGVGKTTFLVYYLREHFSHSNQALYISADHLYFVEHSLLETTDRFIKEFDGQMLCIDEIHKYKNWDQELKNIYDSYPKLRIIFSGSSSIDLIKGKYDLSRRVQLKTMFGFSFREHLEISQKTSFPVLSFEELLTHHNRYVLSLSETSKLLGHLKVYLKTGYYPTTRELTSHMVYQDSLRNIIDKIIYQDISSYYSLYTSNLDTLKKIIYFFATSQPGTVNINRLGKSLKKDYTTIADFVQILRDTGLLRFLPANKQGHALVRDTEKIYLDNTNLLFAVNGEIGKEPLTGLVRELFVLGCLQNAGYHVFASPNVDFECSNCFLEVGGKGKASAFIQANGRGYIVKDDILVGDRKTIPLYLFGFLS